MARKTLTFTVTAESEEALQNLFGILQGHTEQFSDDNEDEEIEIPRNPHIKDAE